MHLISFILCWRSFFNLLLSAHTTLLFVYLCNWIHKLVFIARIATNISSFNHHRQPEVAEMTRWIRSNNIMPVCKSWLIKSALSFFLQGAGATTTFIASLVKCGALHSGFFFIFFFFLFYLFIYLFFFSSSCLQ